MQLEIIPIHPDDAVARGVSTSTVTARRRTFGRWSPSRRTFGRRHPSRRTFGKRTPSRRTFGRRVGP